MPARLDALGFRVDNDGDLDRIVRTAIAETEPVVRPDGGISHVCGTSSRAAVVVHQDTDGAVACVTAFLSAQERTPARLAAVVPNYDCPHCAIILVDAWGPGGVVRIPMATPHFQLWATALEVGSAIEVGLGAVAEAVVPAPPTAQASVVPDPAATAVGVPAPEPIVELCGTVTAHLLRHNDLGGGAFEWATVDCGGLLVEVCAAPGDLARPFKTGDRIAGRFHVSGPVWSVL